MKVRIVIGPYSIEDTLMTDKEGCPLQGQLSAETTIKITIPFSVDLAFKLSAETLTFYPSILFFKNFF